MWLEEFKISCISFFAAQPRPEAYYDCSNLNANPMQYQLMQYSAQYNVPCTIQPGKLRNRYRVEWFSIDGEFYIPLTTINMSNFDLHLNSSNFPHKTKWFYCRVNIHHDEHNTRHYCGQRIRVAGRFYQKLY